MARRKFYLGLLVFFVLLIGSVIFLNSDKREAVQAVQSIYPEKVQLNDVTEEKKDDFIKDNFPAVQRIFQVVDSAGEASGMAFIVEPVGYKGPVRIAVAIDGKTKETVGIKILSHIETPDYAKYLTEKWFTDRFIKKSTSSYLNRVVLDPEKPQDIIQITGATISSQAAVDGVNGAIGAFNYLYLGNKMAAVPASVDQQLLSTDENSFAINGGNKTFRIDIDELAAYPVEKVNTILRKTTGTEQELTAEGPLLDTVLADHGIKMSDYQGIGITARDGYYALISKDIMDNRKIILGYRFDGKEIIPEEKPIRVVVPDEMGVYWVKMVTSIDLYEDISEKDIKSVKMFHALTRDIKPYLYEYYGSKDESIEIGKILAKLDHVDPKGFFTMDSSDGLMKNETINMVQSRYYIKVTGDNAPMNIAPNFKLGMNVKYMAFFSTTHDAVIFPHEMEKVVGTKDLEGQKGLPLDQVLITVGVLDSEEKSWELISTQGEKISVPGSELNKIILIEGKDQKVTAVYESRDGLKKVEDLLEVTEA